MPSICRIHRSNNFGHVSGLKSPRKITHHVTDLCSALTPAILDPCNELFLYWNWKIPLSFSGIFRRKFTVKAWSSPVVVANSNHHCHPKHFTKFNSLREVTDWVLACLFVFFVEKWWYCLKLDKCGHSTTHYPWTEFCLYHSAMICVTLTFSGNM